MNIFSNFIKSLLKARSFSSLKQYYYEIDKSLLSDQSDRGKVFSFIYRTNHWGDKESKSGPGSTIEYTSNIREKLPKLWRELGVKTVLDAPCGDLNWIKKIPEEQIPQYVGCDIVEEIISENKKHFSSSNKKFICLDIVKDDLPEADFWLCRDCLFHMPTSDVISVLNNFLKSNITYFCTTSHPCCMYNRNVTSGGFRLINLELPPYNFCKAMVYIDDKGNKAKAIPQKLAVWRRKDIIDAIESII